MIETRWAHASLAVTDIDVSGDFYRRAFGFETVFEERGMAREIAETVGIAGVTCDLVQLRHPASGVVFELIAFRGAGGEKVPPGPPRGHIALVVADLAAAEAELLRLGAERVGEIVAFDEGPAAYYREPGGSVVELEQLHAPEGA
ncbi:MAG: VOC family protein [Azospirillaceae bacterium]